MFACLQVIWQKHFLSLCKVCGCEVSVTRVQHVPKCGEDARETLECCVEADWRCDDEIMQAILFLPKK